MITNEQKLQVLREKIAGHEHARYGHEVDAQIARNCGFTDIEKSALANAARVQRFIDGYQAEIDALTNSSEAD